jgi:hypothetical protein
MRTVLWLLVPSVLIPLPASGQDSILSAALRDNRHVVELDSAGDLSGDGGELLLAAGRDAQFFLIGEDHGIAEVPALAAALFKALAPFGYAHLAIETGEPVAEHLNRLAREPDAKAAIGDFVRDYWPGVPFYGLEEEAELLIATVAAVGGGDDVIWGLDYDVMGDRYALHRLLELAPSEAARRESAVVIAVADSMLDSALDAGNPAGVFMFAGQDTLIAQLRAAYAPQSGSEADRIIALLEETLHINAAFLERRYGDSNTLRARHLKRQFLRRYRGAGGANGERPRAMFKFGANHLVRGLNFTQVYDLGTLVHELAEAEGGRAFGLMALGGEGSMAAHFNPRTFGYKPGPVETHGLVELLYEEAEPGSWSLFDLRPLRELLRDGELGEVDERARQAIRGYDAVLILSGSGPSHPLVER